MELAVLDGWLGVRFGEDGTKRDSSLRRLRSE